MTPETPTHEVYFSNETQTIGPVLVVVMEEHERDNDMLEAAAVGHDSIRNWTVRVRRLGDNNEATFTGAEAEEWWA